MASIFDLFKKIEAPTQPHLPITHIVAGLGNFGREYDNTRHNAGFSAIDFFAETQKIKINRFKFDALTSEATVNQKRILLMKPQLYMNRSGESIKKAVDFYKIPPENIIVICDDINLDVGKLRIRRKGSDGGQKGLRNTIENLATDSFPRIRLGVGKMPPGVDMISWVLGRFPAEDTELFHRTVEKIPTVLTLLLDGNIEKAMCDFN